MIEVGIIVDQIDAYCDVNDCEQRHDAFIEAYQDVTPFLKTFSDCFVSKLLDSLTHLLF